MNVCSSWLWKDGPAPDSCHISIYNHQGILIYMQMGLFKKDENLQHLASLHKELERLKESYTLALDSANDALWEWNLITDEIVTSDKWIDITGNTESGARMILTPGS